MKKIDMSSEAIAHRFRQTEQLRRLSRALMKAKPISNAEAATMRARIRGEKADINPPKS